MNNKIYLPLSLSSILKMCLIAKEQKFNKYESNKNNHYLPGERIRPIGPLVSSFTQLLWKKTSLIQCCYVTGPKNMKPQVYPISSK